MKQLGKIFRCIVGDECGFSEEGNRQWYYTLALVINVMIAWMRLPHNVAVTFTILSAIHLVSIHIYELIGLYFIRDASIAYTYIFIHGMILIVALITHWKFSLMSILIMIIFLFIAPNDVGWNIFSNLLIKSSFAPTYSKLESFIALSAHTIVFTIFIITVCQLPFLWWGKLLIIAAMMGLHPIIDYLEGECVDVIVAVEDIISEI
ncbi:MAG: hypothetical protein IJ220_02340 [Clostridia bacterium]|nr:hypothetical protein [Clostridia bacterium]